MIIIASVKLEPSTSSSSSSYNITRLAQNIEQNHQSTPIALGEVEDLAEELEKSLFKAVFIGVAVGFVLTLLHFGYMAVCPSFYVKFGLWVEVLLIAIFCCIPGFITKDSLAPMYFAIGGVVVLIGICVYCCCLKDFIEFTCMIFEKTMKIEKGHPGIFFIVFIQIIIEFVINIIYAAAFIFIEINNWNYLIYIYYVLSYYWAIVTNYYVFFLISANLAANCYFLEGTEFFPENPLWDSVKRSLTKTFGSASFAGFIAAVMSTLEHIAEQMMDSDNNVLKLIGCIAYCILCCLQSIFHHVSRYGLFYVTVYNVPFLEGTRRFTELTVKKFITTFFGESVLNTAFTFNSFIFGVIAVVIGLIFSISILVGKENTVSRIFEAVMYPVFILMFTEVFLWCLLNPADTISYSLFICFTEFPERLKVINIVEYEMFSYRYACSTARATKNQLPPRPQCLGQN
jgi:hypothetical protein